MLRTSVLGQSESLPDRFKDIINGIAYNQLKSKRRGLQNLINQVMEKTGLTRKAIHYYEL